MCFAAPLETPNDSCRSVAHRMDTEDLKRERETVITMEEELRLQIANLKNHIEGLSAGKLNRLAT